MIQLETVDELNPRTVEAYEQVALAYARGGMIESDIKACAKSINVGRNVFGNEHPQTAKLVFSLAMLEREKNARALNEQGLAMSAQCLQGNNRDAYSRNNEAQGTRIG